MASAAEQLASNFSLKAFGKAEELKKRIWFTLGALLVYRLGTYIPMPGIDRRRLRRVRSGRAGRRWLVQHVHRRRGGTHGGVCAGHHALHHRLDYHSADDDGVAEA
jgi:hypothetical protein